MPRKQSIWSKLRRTFRNWFEGAVRWTKDRSALAEENPRDAVHDLDQITLTELIRKSRYFVKNNPLAARLSGLFAQYTVGTCGIKVIPASADLKFNEAVRLAWGDFCRTIEVSGKSYPTCSEEGANTLFSDGGYFIRKLFSEVEAPQGVPRIQPRIQLLERHRIQTPDTQSEYEGTRIHNGIQLNERATAVVGYWIRDSLDESKYEFRKKSEVIHVFDSTRPGQIDGMPLLAPAMNRLHDIDDLQILQMKRAKQHARTSNVLKTETGDISDEDAVRETESVTTVDSQGNERITDRLKAYQQASGGEWLALRPNEELQQLASPSPSVTEQWHWQKIESEICACIGISRMLVYPESMQGTVARADLEITTATLRGWSALQAEAWIEVYTWWLDWAVKNLPSLKNPPEDYRRCEYRAPKGPNVDVGRNSKALLSEVEAGIRTYQSVYAEMQEDWRDAIRQKAIEARFIKDTAKEFDIEKSEISTLQEDRKDRFDSGLQQPGNVPPKKKDKEEDDES